MSSATEKLAVHHVGGRFGNGGFPVLPAFEGDLVRVYYDADTDCIEQIREAHAGSAAEVHVLPYCVGVDGAATLHVNYDTTSSSIYPMNPLYGPFTFFSYNHDFVAADGLRTMERRTVSTVSLDSLGGAGRLPGGTPDFLSMDVQGAEFDVLAGSRRTLAAGVLGVVAETGLHPLYQGQRTFADVAGLMTDAGFHFVRFLRYHEYEPARQPVGQRGEGFQVLGDALFLRRLDEVERLFPAGAQRQLAFEKLAFLSIVHGQTSYGIESLRRRGGTPGGAPADGARYRAFLAEFLAALDRMPKRYPRIFSEKYSFELSKRRFAPRGGTDAGGRGLGERLWLRYLYPNAYRLAAIYEMLLERFWAPGAALVLPASPAERTLARYGLTRQARLIKRKRVVQMFFSSERSAAGQDKTAKDTTG